MRYRTSQIKPKYVARRSFSKKNSRVAQLGLNQTIFSRTSSSSAQDRVAANAAPFVTRVMRFYKVHGRHDLPWRTMKANKSGEHDPYKILVSEMMLQQTQVSRVIPKYDAFLKRFPNVKTLSEAELGEVYALWQGLGYNRRARFLRDTARTVVKNIEAKLLYSFPNTIDSLEELPGVGAYTARAIYTFAYNKPCVLIETNVRACVLHHFFPRAKKGSVSDARIEKIMQECMIHVIQKKIQPREWYSALMDYGTYLKETQVNPSRKSRTHVVQKKFKGSVREVRGAILEQLGRLKIQRYKIRDIELRKKLQQFDDVCYEKALAGLMKDGMLLLDAGEDGGWVSLAK